MINKALFICDICKKEVCEGDRVQYLNVDNSRYSSDSIEYLAIPTTLNFNFKYKMHYSCYEKSFINVGDMSKRVYLKGK